MGTGRSTLALMVLLVCAACGGATPEQGRETNADSAPPAAAPPRTLELTADNLAAYERGLRREIEAVQAAQEQSRSATTAQQRGEAIQAAFDTATIPQGAAAAGLPLEDYRELRETIHGVFQTLDFQGKIDGPLSMDLSRADEATKERLARDPFTTLSPSSAAALRGQMDRLVPIWIEYVKMTAVAG